MFNISFVQSKFLQDNKGFIQNLEYDSLHAGGP